MRMVRKLSVDMKTGEEDTVSLVLVLSLLVVEAIDEEEILQGLGFDR